MKFKPRRELGRTGFHAAILGIGDLADRAQSVETCVCTLHRAMDAGLNVIDTAPSYEDGYSEIVVGRALRGRRSGMFVIDKVDHPDRPVLPQVEESLKRLELETVDLFLFHGVSTMADWEKLIAPGGGAEQLDRCITGGKARFKGVSSHHPDVLRAALDSGWCDVVMFAVGPNADRRYVDEILPMAKRLKVGTVCFKTFGAGKLVDDTSGYNKPLPDLQPVPVRAGEKRTPQLPFLSVEECVGYTLTCDPDVALLGLSCPEEQDHAFEAARMFSPLSAPDMERIRERAAVAVEGKGHCWWNP